MFVIEACFLANLFVKTLILRVVIEYQRLAVCISGKNLDMEEEENKDVDNEGGTVISRSSVVVKFKNFNFFLCNPCI